MRLLALTVATAAMVAFAFSQTPRALAQGSETQSGASTSGAGAASQGVTGGSESSERPAGVTSEKGKTSVRTETTKGRHTMIHKRGRGVIAFKEPGRRVVIHKRGRGVVAFKETGRGVVIHKRGRGAVAFREPGRGVVIHKRGRGTVTLRESKRGVMITKREPGMAIAGEARRTTPGARAHMRSRETMGYARARAGGTTAKKIQSKPGGSREQ